MSMVGIDMTPAEPDWALTAPEGELFAYVWWCGDEECDCTQAQIVHIIERNIYGGWRQSKVVWNGNFISGDYDSYHRSSTPNTELNREARRLRKHHHDLHRRISWPWDRKKERAAS